MLKKAGIIAAAAVAGIVALTPLAFAHDEPEMVEYTNVEDGNLTNDCEFAQSGQEITTDATGGDSLLGLGGAVANVSAPISAPIAAANCLNVGVSDVVDSDSNNVTETEEDTEITDSFNGPVED